MAREDVLVHEEEDLGTAMQKLSIPFRELDQLPIDPVYDFTDGLKEIIEDSNLLLEDAREFEAARELEDPNHNESINDSNSSKLFGNSSNPRPTVRFAAPKRSRNKRGRPKRVFFKKPAYLIDSNFAITDKSCSHCGARKTPLWRAGPRGAGTLCNACGVRYRLGRLLPEYRPASSPGFKPNVHSNFHRKVLEIRSERNSPP